MKDQMSSAEYRQIFVQKQPKPQKKSMTAEELRAKMKKKANKPVEKNKEEMRIMLQLAKIQFKTEHTFHPTRKWRFDFAILEHKIAIEYEGIHSEKSRHTTRSGYAKDAEKYREAAKLGWMVLRYTAKDYKSVVDDIFATIRNKV